MLTPDIQQRLRITPAPAYANMAEKEQLRQEIADQVNRFLKAGGSINALPTGATGDTVENRQRGITINPAYPATPFPKTRKPARPRKERAIGTSGYRGVIQRGGRFLAYYSKNYLGSFDTPEEASAAYKAAKAGA